MTSIAKAKRIYQETGSFSVSSAKTGVNRQTLKTWARRYDWLPPIDQKVKPEAKPPSQPIGAWMQSPYLDSAHFITERHAACEGTPSGVADAGKIHWFPHDGNLRKCLRCLKRANTEITDKRA